MKAQEFITEAFDSDAVNELDLFIMNDEDLYRRRFMPIISNIKRKIKKNIYDRIIFKRDVSSRIRYIFRNV